MRRVLAVIGILSAVWLAAPADAQPGAASSRCYPPPCAAWDGAEAPSPAVGAAVPAGPGTTPAEGRTSAPFVAGGLLMIGAAFTAVILRRRWSIARREQPPVHAPAATVYYRQPEGSMH